jgi:hypothetical protein
MEENSKPPSASSARGADILRQWQGMSTELSVWKPQWQEIADLMMPRKAGISTTYETPSSSKEALLFDTTAGDAAMTMAGGLMSWTSPANESWFNYKPIFELRGNDRVKQWLAGCSERIRELLANSNFYTEIHEDLLTHCTFGTSAMFCGMDEGQFRFESLPLGSFAIEEDGFGKVNTLYREMDITAKQAADLFGDDNLPKDVKDCLKDDKKAQQKHKFIHAVYPRPESERPEGAGRNASWGKAFASCYVEVKSKQVVKESGYDSFPFAVGRYLKWSALSSKSPYGYGPGFAALADTRQVNFLQMMLDCAAEKIVRPAMIAPEDMEGELILSAGGITYMPGSIQSDRWPKPIQQTGDYNVAVDRVKMRQEAVNMKFHAELFRMFATLDRQMTAREVAERAAEKIVLISPAFSRLSSEKHNPILLRVFSMAMEAGLLEQPPEEAIIPVSEFMGVIPDPAISYSSRLALALDQLGMNGFERQLETDLVIAQTRPDILDNYDFDRITRDRARSNGMPAAWMLDGEEVAATRQARAEAAQAQQAAMMLEQGSKAVKNMGGVDETKKAMEEMA